VIWATAGRDVRFLAKSGLFEGALKPLVAGSGAIPVYRRIDEGADVSKNARTFSAVDRALAAGDAICLFPEGVSHSAGRLVPLRTGAALLVFVVPYTLTGYAARWFTREPDVAATAKAVGGFLIYTAWLVALSGVVWWWSGGTAGLLAFASLAAIAVAGLFAIERESAVLDAVRAWFLLRRTRDDTRERLKRQRSELADVLDQVRDWLNEQLPESR
jgi:hypothetical protein